MRSFNLGHPEVLVAPVTEVLLNDLGPTRLVSPRAGDSHGYEPPSEELYREQVAELVQLREEVEAGTWSKWWWQKYMGTDELSPLLSKYLRLHTRRPQECADTVRMDHPFDIWDVVVEPYLIDEGVLPAVPYKHQGNPFVERTLARSNAHARIASGLNKVFDVKYEFCVCRPVEFYDCSLQRFETPNHGECPAGHGGFCGASAKAAELEYRPSAEQVSDIVFCTKQFAMFRSLSAMHIPYSNLLGWQVGYDA